MPGSYRKRQSSASTSKNNKKQQPRKKQQSSDEPVDKKAKIIVSDRLNERLGHVLTFGQGDVGQLGLGEDITERKKPALVQFGDQHQQVQGNFVQVVAGGMHTVSLTSSGQVFTFGCNDEGALGRVTNEDEGEEFVPGQVMIIGKVCQVSAGDSHSAALTEEGQVFAWGTFRDGNGVIGLTQEGRQNSPVKLFAGLTVVQISSGSDHLCALTREGAIFTVGNSEQGQLGRVAECFSYKGGRKGLKLLLQPGQVRFRKTRGHTNFNFKSVWCSSYCTFAVLDDGAVYAWGLNNYHHLGLEEGTVCFVPTRINSFAGLRPVAIQGGQHHTLVLDREGLVHSLGRVNYGRLGLGPEAEESHIPQQIETLRDIGVIGCGSSCSFAVNKIGELFAWGMGNTLQLGTGSEEDLDTPGKVTGKQLEHRKVLMVSSGGQHTVLLAADD